MKKAYAVLQKYFGYTSFRDGQEEVVSAVLSGRDVLCVMPTGAGKSLCYQVPALTLSGITLVISPLTSLMKDQVRSLKSAGVDAAYINSSLTYGQYLKVLQNTAAGMYKIIYVAPERLESQDFLSLCAGLSISLVAVDEAHCVSQWGQDFRPSYLGIPDFINALPNRPVLAAFTATAAVHVREDIRSLLQLQSPYECVKGFDRPNLYFGVQQVQNRKIALLDIISQRQVQSGIVYCMARKTVEEICDFLKENGIAATRYHAGLSDTERRMNQDDFLYDRQAVMVATSAFGMGIDKSNVSYVIHYNMPPDLESYYQEAGRAGRDGSAADCILLFSPGDFYTCRSLITGQEPAPDMDEEQREFLLERAMKRLSDMYDYGSATDCLRGRILRYFGEDGMEACGNCSNCLAEMVETDATVDVQKILSCIVKTGERYSVGTVSGVLQGSKSEKIREAKLDSLSVWGIMKEKTPAYIKRVVEFLINEGILDCVGEFRILKCTPMSRDILRGKREVMIRLPADLQVDKAVKEKKKKATVRKISGTAAVNSELYERLRKLRTELAAAEKIPPYMIAANMLLEEICAMLPTDRDTMLAVRGMGEAKFARYGQQFLDVVRAWCTENNGQAGVADEMYSTVPTEMFGDLPPLSDADAPPEDLYYNMMLPEDMELAVPSPLPEIRTPEIKKDSTIVKSSAESEKSVAAKSRGTKSSKSGGTKSSKKGESMSAKSGETKSRNSVKKDSTYDAGMRNLGFERTDTAWESAEEEQLRKEVSDGLTLIQISKAHSRPVFEVFSKMRKLGLA